MTKTSKHDFQLKKPGTIHSHYVCRRCGVLKEVSRRGSVRTIWTKKNHQGDVIYSLQYSTTKAERDSGTAPIGPSCDDILLLPDVVIEAVHCS